uniref:Pentatricopeptide repeat-containing protein n=1 Tax=Kalanchoe fedtschenkoi TaxID=63787 RepID=A0A7N0UM22_KALFE
MASLPLLPTPLPISSPRKPRNSFQSKPAHLKESPDHDKGNHQNLHLDYLHRVSALCKDAKIEDAVDLVTELELRDGRIGPEFYGELLQGCVYERALLTGQQIHARILKNGELFAKNEYIETKLVIFYAKCDVADVAKSLFDRRSQHGRDVFLLRAHTRLNSNFKLSVQFRLMRLFVAEKPKFVSIAFINKLVERFESNRIGIFRVCKSIIPFYDHSSLVLSY